MKKTLFVKTFLGYAAVIALLAAAVTLVAPPLMRTHHIEERSASLEHMAFLLEGQVLPYVLGTAAGDLEGFVTAVGHRTGTRITVIDAAGAVLADSEQGPADMENHLFRPEIQAALRGEKQMSIRPSSTMKADMMYMSIPLRSEGRVIGALRLSVFMKDIEALLGVLRNDLLKVVGAVSLLALVLAFFLTRSVTGPVREAVAASKRVAAGDFDVTVSERRSGDLREFARGFNLMTRRLKDMFGETQVQGQEIQSILASIREGLCVVDKEDRIVLSNKGFHRIVGHDAPEGRYFWEIVRSSSLVDIIHKVRKTRVDTSEEASIGDRAFLCSAIYLAAGDRLVLTLRDVTAFQAPSKA
jgi:two-component system, OmpR family, phosphate regulon sensor histidine kinase PhoR